MTSKMRRDNFKKLIKGCSIHPKHFLKCRGIKMIHLFYCVPSVPMVVPCLPTRLMCFTTCSYIEVISKETPLPAKFALACHNTSNKSCIADLFQCGEQNAGTGNAQTEVFTYLQYTPSACDALKLKIEHHRQVQK